MTGPESAHQQAICMIAPHEIVTANQRGHWARSSGKTRRLRAVGQYELGRQLKPVTGRVRVVVTFAMLDRRRRDQANLAPTAKALIDGMTDAGIWPDDNNTWVEGPDCRIDPALSPDADTAKPAVFKRVQVTVTLTPVQELA